MGFFGTFYPTELSKLDYEIYVVNGFSSKDYDDDDPKKSQFVGDGESFIREFKGKHKE